MRLPKKPTVFREFFSCFFMDNKSFIVKVSFNRISIFFHDKKIRISTEKKVFNNKKNHKFFFKIFYETKTEKIPLNETVDRNVEWENKKKGLEKI